MSRLLLLLLLALPALAGVPADPKADPAGLSVAGAALKATQVIPACDGALKIQNTGTISTRVAESGGVKYVPLADIVAALGGAAKTDPRTYAMGVTAGGCPACVLGAVGKP